MDVNMDAWDAGMTRRWQNDLRAWFQRHRRRLPWRQQRTVYRVWLAEVMLQQTRTGQAQPYFERFVRRFPTLAALAAAPLRDVLKAWEGLGYYGRARRLHQTARHVHGPLRGQWPRTYAGLLELPGIGPYTAAAVGSLAFGLPVAVLDGNVRRVLARVLALDTPVDQAAGQRILTRHLERLLPAGWPGEFNEAMMELGALVCLPRQPACSACPVRWACRAAAEGRAERYPCRRPRKPRPHKIVGAGLVVNRRGAVLLAQRKAEDMLGGLWEFPGGTLKPGESMPECIQRELQEELGIDTAVGACLIVVPHEYTHVTIELHAHWARVRAGRPRPLDCAAAAWVPRAKIRTYPMSRADIKILEAMEKLPPGNLWRWTGIPANNRPRPGVK